MMEQSTMVTTRLAEKLARIRKNPEDAKDFLICDAKDGDMGGGIPMPGPLCDDEGRPTSAFKSRSDYLGQITALVRQDIVDLVLLSVANLERLIGEAVFRDSRVGTAIRANDTTDIWGARHGVYKSQPSLPHRSALIEHAMYGRQGVAPGTPPSLTDLGLYSITFMNDAELDRAAGECYREFRIEAERFGFKHFLEVFNPNVGSDKLSRAEVGAFVNDNIVRVIAAVPEACRPQFLKIAYNGPKALEQLVTYDPTIIVGILGGGAGTTRDTFELLAAAQRGGARLVLFGRKINLAEDPLALVGLMRRLVDGEIESADAVRAYHDHLARSGTRPLRTLEDDLEISEEVLR
jgi:hypothetical protein